MAARARKTDRDRAGRPIAPGDRGIDSLRQTGTTQSGERHGTKTTFHPDNQADREAWQADRERGAGSGRS